MSKVCRNTCSTRQHYHNLEADWAPYHFASEENTVFVLLAAETRELGLELISCPGRRLSVQLSILSSMCGSLVLPLAIDWFVEKSVKDVIVERYHVFYPRKGCARQKAEDLKIIRAA